MRWIKILSAFTRRVDITITTVAGLTLIHYNYDFQYLRVYNNSTTLSIFNVSKK